MEIREAIYNRRSVRKFQDKQVDDQIINSLLEDAMAAPSACNKKPWEFYVVTNKEKLQALSEAIRVTKKGGILFCAYCMGDASVLLYGFRRGKIHELMEKCMLDPVTFHTFSKPWDLFELHRKEDIEALRSHFNVTPLHFVATDGYANHMRETLAEMDDEMFELYLRYHFATCERQDMIGYSNHTLDIFRKDG